MRLHIYIYIYTYSRHDSGFLRFRDERARQRTVDVAALKELELASSMFYICIRWRVTIGWARGGEGDVLQDLLERPFVLVSASRGGGEI